MISKIDARKGSNSLLPPELDGAIVTGDFLSYTVEESIIRKEFFDIIVRSPMFAELCDSISSGSTNRVRLDVSRFLSLEIMLPPLLEQQRIVDLIGSLNDAIAAADFAVTTARTAASNLQRELQAPRKGWHHLCLQDVFSPVSDKLGTHKEEPPVFSISKHDGVVLSTDYHDRRMASAKLDGYKLLAPDDWAYSTIHIDEGSIARNLHGYVGVVSPMYTILKWKDDRLNPSYFERLLRSPEMLTVYGDMAKGSINRRRSLSWSVFSSIEVAVPDPDLQHSIVGVLDAAEEPVREASNYAQSLRQLLSELLTVLLSGEHAIPESYEVDALEPVSA